MFKSIVAFRMGRRAAASSRNGNCGRHVDRTRDATAGGPAHQDDFPWERCSGAFRREKMKMIYFLLLTTTSAVLAGGIGHAASLSPNPSQAGSDNAPAATNSSGRSAETEASPGGGHPSDSKARSEKPNARGAAKTRPRIPAAAAEPARLGQAPGARGQTMPATPTAVRSLARAQSSVAANRGPMQNEAIYRALPVRSGRVIRPAAASASPVRHRDPNAAIIGGAASPNSRTTASIDGASTSLKSPRN